MKLKPLTLQLVILMFVVPFLTLKGQSREIITLQTGWKFSKGNFEKASLIKFDDSK